MFLGIAMFKGKLCILRASRNKEKGKDVRKGKWKE
jgi:hypothetical protein